jgi:hypothetical protein
MNQGDNSDPGKGAYQAAFLIFRWGGQGYFPRPGGPSAPFIHREKADTVPQMEISKTLHLLEMDEDIFWRMDGDCQVNPPSPSQKQEAKVDEK